jgi:CheY-like chemotaxis protein
MGQNVVISPDESFVKELRNALNHLYDPEYLRENPLVDILRIGNRLHTPFSLQDILVRTIESMKPEPGAIHKAHAQNVYDILLYRYIQQFSQDEIANQLGISNRHLRRQQQTAIYELACRLWKKYGLQRLEPDDLPQAASAGETKVGGSRLLLHELNWLKDASGLATTDLAEAMAEIAGLIFPLAKEKHIRIVPAENVSGLVLIHAVALQQLLLNILSMAIQRPGDHDIYMKIFSTPDQKILEISRQSRQPDPVNAEKEWLNIIHELANLCCCKFEFLSSTSQFKARITLDVAIPINVLVIDDNEEIITLTQRYVSETRYRIFGVTDPKAALQEAGAVKPDVVIMDIMMPQVDGLQLLSQFKHHPVLGSLPVIICSVLPQKQLATSLGANGFLQKPIQRDAFLEALSQAHHEIET